MLFSTMSGNGDKNIIFIHGNSQSGEVWKQVIEKLLQIDNYRCTAVDLPGHGGNPPGISPETDYSLQGMAQHIFQFMQQFQHTDYIMVAHSLGSNIVAEIADSLTAKGFFLVVPDIIGEGFTTKDIFQPNQHLNVLFTPEPTKEALDGLINDMVINKSKQSETLLEKVFLQADPNVRKYLMESIVKEEWCDEIEKLTSSKALIGLCYGENEKLCFTDYLNRSTIKKWRNKILMIPDSGHSPQLDNPEMLADLLNSFAKDCF